MFFYRFAHEVEEVSAEIEEVGRELDKLKISDRQYSVLRKVRGLKAEGEFPDVHRQVKTKKKIFDRICLRKGHMYPSGEAEQGQERKGTGNSIIHRGMVPPTRSFPRIL